MTQATATSTIHAQGFYLPWPPSVNHYWRHIIRHSGKKAYVQVLVSAEGQKYQKEVADALVEQGVTPMNDARLKLEIMAYAPNKRKTDLDNRLKATLDALQRGGLYDNDSQIDDLRIVRGDVDKSGGSLFVNVVVAA